MFRLFKLSLLTACLTLSLSSAFTQVLKEPAPYDGFLLQTGHNSWINYLQKRGDMLVSSSRDHTIRLWDLKTGNLIDTFFMKQEIETVLLTEDGRYILGTDISGCIFKLDIASGNIILSKAKAIDTRFHNQVYLLGNSIILINQSEIQALDIKTFETLYYISLGQELSGYSGSHYNVTREGNILKSTNGFSLLKIDMSTGEIKKEDLPGWITFMRKNYGL